MINQATGFQKFNKVSANYIKLTNAGMKTKRE